MCAENSLSMPLILQMTGASVAPRKGVYYSDGLDRRDVAMIRSGVLYGGGKVEAVPVTIRGRTAPYDARPSTSAATDELPAAGLRQSSSPTPRGRLGVPKDTIVTVDMAAPHRRQVDGTSVESKHATVLERNPNAFKKIAGFSEQYMTVATRMRAVTPVLSSHMRLTSLETTLKQMSLHPQHTAAALGQSTMGSTGVFAASGSGWAGTTRSRQRSSSAPRFSSRTHRPHQPSATEDRSLLAATNWMPAAPAAAVQLSTLHSTGLLLSNGSDGGVGKRILLDVPPPPALLRPRGEGGPFAEQGAAARTFTSRSSSRGITPAIHTSALEQSLQHLVDTSAAGEGSAEAASASASGSSDVGSTGPLSLPHLDLERQQQEEEADTAAAEYQELYSPIPTSARTEEEAGASAPSSSDAAAMTRSAPGPTSRATARTGHSGSSSISPGGTHRMSASHVKWVTEQQEAGRLVSGGTVSHAHPSWTVRAGHTLARMPDASELLQLAALQARQIRRLEAHHETDLGTGFIDTGAWGQLGLRGDTQGAGRYTLRNTPRSGVLPTTALHGVGPLRSAGANRQSDSDGETSPTAAAAAAYASAGSVYQQTTALGQLLQERADSAAAPAEAAAAATVSRLATTAGSGHRLGQTRGRAPASSSAAAEVAQLDSFDAAHDAHNPKTWPKREIRAKIKHSGAAVLNALGLDDAKLERMEKEELLTVLDRIPATQRLQSIYGPRRANPPGSLDGTWSSVSLSQPISVPEPVVEPRPDQRRAAEIRAYSARPLTGGSRGFGAGMSRPGSRDSRSSRSPTGRSSPSRGTFDFRASPTHSLAGSGSGSGSASGSASGSRPATRERQLAPVAWADERA